MFCSLPVLARLYFSFYTFKLKGVFSNISQASDLCRLMAGPRLMLTNGSCSGSVSSFCVGLLYPSCYLGARQAAESVVSPQYCWVTQATWHLCPHVKNQRGYHINSWVFQAMNRHCLYPCEVVIVLPLLHIKPRLRELDDLPTVSHSKRRSRETNPRLDLSAFFN